MKLTRDDFGELAKFVYFFSAIGIGVLVFLWSIGITGAVSMGGDLSKANLGALLFAILMFGIFPIMHLLLVARVYRVRKRGGVPISPALVASPAIWPLGQLMLLAVIIAFLPR
ncbi:MAG: hypothetical protein EOP59_00040 [Sphingomonadales bacterium]|nr:MAG: hypothetical protein EOP59_00040 [Sphingomonadales bacterium]